MRRCYTINVNQDEICEDMPNEKFFSNLTLESGILSTCSVFLEHAEVVIDDSQEAECRKC